ncbi:MAG: hypothetical protein AAB444_00865 [Patescibacteria group bacterium]
MRNLCYFFHYHHGNRREKTIKIGGSFLIVLSLLVWGMSSSQIRAAERYIDFTSSLLPEPVMKIAADEAAATDSVPTTSSPQTPQEAKQTAPGQPAPAPDTRPAPPMTKPEQNFKTGCPPGESPGINDRGEKSCLRQNMEQDEKNGPGDENFSEAREEMEKHQAAREKNDVAREIKQQKNEIARLKKQLKRLKGTADDVVSADTIASAIAEHEKTILNAQETEDIRDAVQAYRDSELWEEIQKVRRKVELPNELNMIFKELKKSEKLLTQKSFAKLGFDLLAVKVSIAEKLTKHAEAKTAYTQGDFETAEDILQEEFRENHPGNLSGALQMLKGMKDQMRAIRDKTLKADIEDLLGGVIESINAGEWQDARESMDAMNKELAPVVWKKLMQSESGKRGVPQDMRNKIDNLKQKLGDAGDTEETPQTPTP